MTSWRVYTHERSMFRCEDLAPRLVVSFLLLLTTVTTLHAKDCTDYVDGNGANVHNCSSRDMTLLPELPKKAEVLDFSWNKFMQLPNITESADCDVRCPKNDSTSHCRQTVCFSRNHITKLPLDALSDLRCLRTLDLSFNEIKAEALGVLSFFTGVYHLQRLLLNNNPLGSLGSNVITQPFSPDLRELDVSYCELETLDASSVDDFRELRLLNMSFNKLKTIHADAFKGLRRLEHLDLRTNELTSFPEHIFGDLDSLKVMLLSDNKIQGFHIKAFYSDSSLQVLDLSNNRLTSVPYTTLENVVQLTTLDLSQNPIRKVTRGPKQSNVQSLALDNMPELTDLGPYALASFPALVSLSISGNKVLTTIDPKFLGDNQSSLKQVRLENNQLSTLEYDALPWKQLEAVSLDGNPWVCDDALEWMIKTPGFKGDVTCAWPLMLKGHDIKTLNPDDLMRNYSLQSATALIILSLCLPVFGVCAILTWRRRRFCPCVKTSIKGQYVSLFINRGMDEDSDNRVAVTLKTRTDRINAVSNGSADDSIPFIRLHDISIKEELEAE